MATIPPVITPSPAVPQRGDKSTFNARVDAFLTWLSAVVSQFGAVATNCYNNALAAFSSAESAASSANAANDKVGLAAQQVVLATEQKTLAAQRADAAAGSAASALAAAAAAGSAAGLPAFAGNGGRYLGVKNDESGVEYRFIPEQYLTGDLLITARNPGLGWLTAATVYLKSAYTALFAQVGLIKDQAFGDVLSTKWQISAGNGTNGIYYLERLSATLVVAISRNPANTAWVVLRSINNGAIWETVHTFETYRDVRSLKRLTATSFLVSGGSSTNQPSMFVAKFTNAGSVGITPPTVFAVEASAVNNYFAELIPISATIIYAVRLTNGALNGFFKSTDGGSTFVAVTGYMVDNGFVSISRVSDTVFYAINTNGIVFKTTDAGINFAVVSVPTSIAPIGSNAYPTNVIALNETVLFMWRASGSNEGAIAVSRNGGVTWQKQVYIITPNYVSPQIAYNVPSSQGVVKYSETAILMLINGYIMIMDAASATAGTFSEPFSGTKMVTSNGNPLVNSPTELLFSSANSNQVQRTSLYSYDETTQFKTPSVAGLVGAAAYVKA